MNVKRRLGILWVSAIGVFAGASTALAQNTQSQPVLLTDPLGGKETFISVTNSVINFLVTDIAIPLTVIMVLVGAFQIMTSAGDPEKFSTGRKTITYAAIGFAAALIATGITTLIKNFLGQ